MYAVMIMAGIVVAVVISERRLRARGFPNGTALDLVVWAVPCGIVGARLYHVITDWKTYFGAGGDPVRALYIWQGGLGIWGAIAGGGLGVYIAARRRHLSFVVVAAGATVTHDPLPTVTGMPTELRQLFTNLVGNAVKFRGDEPVHVHVSAAREGSMWRFSVADNGIGHRPCPSRADLRGVHPAPSRPVPGHRHRPRDLQEGRRTPRRAHLGRVATRYGATFRFTLPAADNDQGDR